MRADFQQKAATVKRHSRLEDAKNRDNQARKCFDSFRPCA
jgi:hypothetical protein